MSVQYPTLTPAMSVMALNGPVGSAPTVIPRSRRRTRVMRPSSVPNFVAQAEHTSVRSASHRGSRGDDFRGCTLVRRIGKHATAVLARADRARIDLSKIDLIPRRPRTAMWPLRDIRAGYA